VVATSVWHERARNPVQLSVGEIYWTDKRRKWVTLLSVPAGRGREYLGLLKKQPNDFRKLVEKVLAGV
jgi:hypothetical protein